MNRSNFNMFAPFKEQIEIHTHNPGSRSVDICNVNHANFTQQEITAWSECITKSSYVYSLTAGIACLLSGSTVQGIYLTARMFIHTLDMPCMIKISKD